MLWMGIWVPPYTVTHVQLGVHDDSWMCGYVWSLCNDVRSCLRLYTSNTDGFPHSYHNSHKCFCLLLCSGWGYGCTFMLISVQVEEIFFWKFKVWLNTIDAVRSWWGLYTTSLCIPVPYYIYILCFQNLLCCEWGYGWILMRISV